jgi:GntR family transcriptional repressor for pyruvate dehydrogenase complex
MMLIVFKSNTLCPSRRSPSRKPCTRDVTQVQQFSRRADVTENQIRLSTVHAVTRRQDQLVGHAGVDYGRRMPSLSADLHDLADVSRAPLSLAVANQMRTAIETGTWQVGQALPTEQSLAGHFGVGRSTVREALRILQSQGLVTGGDSVSTARPRVTNGQIRGRAADAMNTAVLLGQIPLTDLVDLRLLLECDSVARAAAACADNPASHHHLDEAHRCLDAMMLDLDDLEHFHRRDVEFHIALARAAGNDAVCLVMEVLRTVIESYLMGALRDRPNPRRVAEHLAQEHRQILIAVEAGRAADASALMRSHIAGFYDSESATTPDGADR